MQPRNISMFKILLIVLCFISCNNTKEDKIHDLVFATNTYSVRTGSSKNIMISGGNRDYTITSADEGVVRATVAFNSQVGFGDIRIEGFQKGSTIITVKDNITGQEKKLNVVVTDMYLGFDLVRYQADVQITNTKDKLEIEKDIATKTSLNTPLLFFLVKNEEKTLYIFQSKEEMWKNKILYQGSYEFEVSSEFLCLCLNFENNEITEEHRYKLSFSSSNTFSLINQIFELGLENPSTKMSVMQPLFITLAEDYTKEYELLYPKLETAKAITTAKISTATDEEIPLELLKQKIR